jgi:hypothetical protein
MPFSIAVLPCLALAYLVVGGSPRRGWLRLLLERKRLEEERRIEELRRK